jgi:multidrug efflux pump subunit AcrA (membrane-fusion protein)
MLVNNPASSSTRKFPRLFSLAAVFIAALVVGSMVWFIAVTHPFSGGTTIVASGATSSQVSSKPPVISGQGTVYPNQEQDVQYPKSMYVAAVNVSNSQTVKVGQTLMQLYPADNAQVQGMYARVLTAETQLKTDQLNHPERVAADQQQLAQAQSYLTRTLAPVTDSQIQLAQAKVNSYQALLQQDQANHSDHVTADIQRLQLAQSELAQMQAQKNMEVTVTASISGVIKGVIPDPGKIVAANTIMLAVMDEVAVVHAHVSLANANQIHIHQLATVTTSARPGLSLTGSVTKIIPPKDPKSHTFEVWVAVPNAINVSELLIDMPAQVQIR